MQPVVGVSVGWRQNVAYNATAYTRPVLELDGLAALLPYRADEPTLDAWLGVIDGLLLAGGADIDPRYYGEDAHLQLGRVEEDRDRFELAIARAALERDVPVLGVCRGLQLLNVAQHGSLYQDIPSQVPGAIDHRHGWADAMKAYWDPSFMPRPKSHPVQILSGTRLATILGAGELAVNSYHHQAAKQVATGWTISGRTHDGLVEAIESDRHGFALGVQWHAELMWPHAGSRALFGAFVDVCRARRAKRASRF